MAFGENNTELEFVGDNVSASSDTPLFLRSGGVTSKLNLVAVSNTNGSYQTERARKD